MGSSARQALLQSVRSFRLVNGLKRVIPDAIKAGVIRAIAGGQPGFISLASDVSLSFPLDDYYWSRVAAEIRSYEPELWFVLERVLNANSLFIDCGANIGLWSCFAAAKIGSGRGVVAIEPGFKVRPHLLRNCRDNNLNFTVLNNAIWSKSGERRTFFAYEGHAASSLVEDTSRKLLDKTSIETVSIDDVVEDAIFATPGVSNIVIKLDVEGVEREAIAGAAQTLNRDNVLLIYEDHGRDNGSEVTGLCLGIGMRIYFYCDSTLRIIESKSEATAVKKDYRRGYNFFACKPGTAFDMRLRHLASSVPADERAAPLASGHPGIVTKL